MAKGGFRGGMPNGNMMKQFQKMQEEFSKMQQELESTEFSTLPSISQPSVTMECTTLASLPM